MMDRGQFEPFERKQHKINAKAAFLNLAFRGRCSNLWRVAWTYFFFSACATGSTQSGTPQILENTPSEGVHGELSSESVEAGAIVLVKVHRPPSLSKSSVQGEFEGISLPFFEAPEFGPGVLATVLGVPYERKVGPAFVSIRVDDGSSGFQLPFQVIDGHYRSESLHVDSRRVNPTRKKDLIRIQQDIALVTEIYRKVTPQKYWSGPFTFPIQSPITSPFGIRRIYNGRLKNFHPGLDLKAALKTPVLAPASGVIVLAKDLFYTGNTVMIDHGYGLITLYAHLSHLNVKVGQVVQAQELLGLSGKTGRVNGPHLHWQAVVHHVKVNPLGLIQVLR